jgi:hypothetical protein
VSGLILANPAIYAFVGMDDQHVLALIEAIHGADFHTIHQLTFDATLIDYIGHLSFLPDRLASQLPTRTTVFVGCAINIPYGCLSLPPDSQFVRDLCDATAN